MNYPLISEYIEAIKAAKENFDELKNLRPVLDEDGEPVMTSGNFAVVFKMKNEQTGKMHAVKCFLKEQEGRAEAYRMIAEELEYVNSTFLTAIKYMDKELFVDSKNSDETEFPVLLMDWVEGKTLDKYIREHIDDQYELSLLAYQFSRLAMWLMPQPFAHGDLKPDNILVKDDGTLVLVDYDGMYVPAMKGQKARELGSPDFRHPGRTEDDFDEHIDDFSLASILLSLKAISLQPSLLEEYGASDRLLFSEKDYRNLSESLVMDALKPLMQDAELASLYSLYILALSQKNLSQVSFRLFNLNRPDKSQYEEENLSTEVTEEDLANAWTDEYGVKYSKDRKRLLKAPIHLKEYSIRKGTLVICDFAFTEFYFIKVNDNRKSELSSLLLPIGIKAIGRGAFIWCEELKELTIPNTVIFIGDAAFYNCFRLCNISIPSSLTRIEDEMFVSCQISRLSLPLSIKAIGNRAFWNCSLSDITIPNSVTTIEEGAFSGCPLSSVTIPNSITKIEDETFYECFTLKRVILPNSVTEIGNLSFYSCAFAEIELPNSIVRIGYHAFNYCESLKQIDIPDSVEVIEEGAFANCYSLESVRLPKSIKKLGDSLFNECDELKHIIIPIGTKKKFEKLLPEHKDKLVEESNVVSITFDNSSTSKVDRCHVFKKNNEWKLEIVYKNGMKIEYPHSLLQGNQSIVFDKQTIEKMQLYVGCCEGFYINPEAVKVDFKNPSNYTAKILFDSDYIEISGITWGLNNDINEWKVKGVRSFNIEERLLVKRAEVVSSDYGYSVCFFMNAGGQTYIPLDTNSGLCVGDELNMNTAKILTLCRKGKDDIVRVIE